jgi:hypothetical protein
MILLERIFTCKNPETFAGAALYSSGSDGDASSSALLGADAPGAGAQSRGSKQQQQEDRAAAAAVPGASGLSCLSCGATFEDAAAQRAHFKTDWHRLNQQRKIRGQLPISEADFDLLIEKDEVGSISGSDNDSDEDEDEEEEEDDLFYMGPISEGASGAGGKDGEDGG